MKRLYGSDSAPLVGYLASALKAQGIPCTVRNGYLAGGVGELPPTAVWPEIWVTDERDVERASRLLADLLGETGADAGPWRCPACGEALEGQFTECWRCGASRAG